MTEELQRPEELEQQRDKAAPVAPSEYPHTGRVSLEELSMITLVNK